MENKEIEAWFEGVIIGPGMTQFVNEARAYDATRPAMADMGFKDWVPGTVARATSCLTTNAFIMRSGSNHVLLYFLPWLIFSDQRNKAESSSHNMPMGHRYRWREPSV